MVSQCANPKCGTPFLYLREGRLVAVRHNQHGSSKLEFFWLCGDCASHLKFAPPLDGTINVVPILLPSAL